MSGVDHTKKNISEALGVSDEEYNWIKDVVKKSTLNTNTISEAIEHALEQIRHKEFGKLTSHPSKYEYKLALAGMVVGMVLQNSATVEQHIVIGGTPPPELKSFFEYIKQQIEERQRHHGH
jgi:hypothetical protein